MKIDKGLENESDGVQRMKPIPGLDALLNDAVGFGIFGTKERSVIAHASKSGIQAIVDQQFEIGRQVASHGLVPILEPEVSIKAPDKAQAEQMLFDALMAGADKWTGDVPFMVKITIPDETDLYAPLIAHANVLRVVALSGGYERDDACARLAKNHNLIASFSRALVEGLTRDMSDADFDARLGATIAEIYQASTDKRLIARSNHPARDPTKFGLDLVHSFTKLETRLKARTHRSERDRGAAPISAASELWITREFDRKCRLRRQFSPAIM